MELALGCFIHWKAYHVLQVILSSGETVVELQPQFDLICKCPGRGIMISGPAPLDSGFDYYYRLFCPKLRVNEVKYVWHLVSNNVMLFKNLIYYQSLFGLFIALITCFWLFRMNIEYLWIHDSTSHEGFLRLTQFNALIRACIMNWLILFDCKKQTNDKCYQT